MQTPARPTTVTLNGRWSLLATTYSFLSNPDRVGVELIYRGDPADPTMVQQETRWRVGGSDRHLRGRSTPLADGTHRWRGRGLGAFVSADWSFVMASDGSFAVVRFAATLLSDAGYHVIGRRGVDASVVRERLAVESASLGLPRTGLASLRWRQDG